MIEVFINYNGDINVDVGEWAHEREAEGWDGIVFSDHYWIDQLTEQFVYPHIFVSLTHAARSTSRIRLASSFCNNLFRSPVEFAQAALSLHRASNGRFEAGLGAGWAEAELRRTGQYFPPPKERATRYREAMTIVRTLFDTGKCQFEGEYYTVDVPLIGPRDDTWPLLVGSLGGPRTTREVAPLLDRAEVFAGEFNRSGAVDFEVLARLTEDDVRALVERVRAVRPDIPIGYFALMGAGDNQEIADMRQLLGDGFAGNFFGTPQAVAQHVRKLEGLGFSRVQLTAAVPTDLPAFARAWRG